MTNMKYTMMLIWTILIMSLLIFLIKIIHPVMMIILLLTYNILLTINMSMWSKSYLFSLLFLLIMITGLLMIFMYFSSLISNEKSIQMSLHEYLLLIWTTILFLITMNLSMPSMLTHDHLILSYFLKSPPLPYPSLLKFYSSPMFPITLMSMIYLILSLFTIMKIISPKSKSLRKIS